MIITARQSIIRATILGHRLPLLKSLGLDETPNERNNDVAA